jgi:hypothetical protein
MSRIIALGGLAIIIGIAIGLGRLPNAQPVVPPWFIPIGLLIAVMLALRRRKADRSAILIIAAALGVILLGVSTRTAAVTLCIAGTLLVAIGSQLQDARRHTRRDWILWIAGAVVILLILFAV